MPKAKHHKRRMSGVKGKNDALMMIVGGVIGYVATNALNTQVTTVKDEIKAGAEVTLPILFSKKLKSSLLKGIGVGVAIAGTKVAGKAFNIPILAGMPVVSGYPVVNGARRRMGNYVGGSADQPYLRTGAAGNQNILSGVPAKKMKADEVFAGAMMENSDQ